MMCNIDFCNNCSEYDICHGVFADVYSFLQQTSRAALQKMCDEYMPQCMKDNIVCSFDNDIIYDIYHMPERLLTYSCFFGFCRNWILHKPPYQTYASMLRIKYPEEFEGWIPSEMGSHPLYKQRMRYLKKIAQVHNIPVENLTKCNQEMFDRYEFIFNYRYNRKIRSDSSDEIIEHKRPFKQDIFSYMYPYEFTKNHNYRANEFKEDLENIKIIYKDIEENSDSYFQKCLRYDVVEYCLHYETAYKFVKYLNNIDDDFTQEERIKLLFWEANLRKTIVQQDIVENSLMEFPFIIHIDSYIQLFFDEYLNTRNLFGQGINPQECSRLLTHLSIVYNYTVRTALDRYKEDFELPEDFNARQCGFAENIFENYIGKGQHITHNKDLSIETVKDIMEIFSRADTVEERLRFYKLID